jgi:metal-responsive CopG/Arc/MetJ family transcriptional regulator
MKVKTSITLSEELIRSIEKLFGKQQNKSEFIEKAVTDYIKNQIKKERDINDLAILNKKADKLNKEAADVLMYQVDL